VALEDGQVLWVSEAAHDKLHAEGKLGSPPPVAETSSTMPPPAAGGDEGLQPAPAPSPQPEPQTSGQTTSSPSAVAARRDQAVTRLGSRSSQPSQPGFERLDITEALAKLLAEARQAKKDSEAAPTDTALQAAFVEKRRLYKQAKERSQARSTQPSSGATSGEANQLQQQIARMQRDNRQAQQKMEQRMEKLQATVDLQSTHTSATCALM